MVEEDEVEVDVMLVVLVDVELALVDDEVALEAANDVDLLGVVLLVVDEVVDLDDGLLDVVEEKLVVEVVLDACGRRGCRCRAGCRP